MAFNAFFDCHKLINHALAITETADVDVSKFEIFETYDFKDMFQSTANGILEFDK